MNNQNKIFIVEFGKPDMGNYISLGSSRNSLFVIAESYEKAFQKAIVYAESQDETQSVIDEDGSLRLRDDNYQIKSIKMVSDIIVF